MTPLLLWMLLGQAGDLATTHLAVRAGCRETNPIYRPVLKAGLTVSLTFTLPLAHKEHPKLAKWGAGLVAASGTVGTVINARNLSRGCR
jgi:hypothetical protein